RLSDLAEMVVEDWSYQDPRGQTLGRGKQVLEDIFTAERGFGGIERINVQDGIRCFFRNGDIAHIRPSGNAPQLRIYAHARTQERADQITAMAVAEPNGMLRDLQRFIESEIA
ncbi:MAG: hypothetical protein LJE70_19885, partial [Chromatiaceae bacterium]|nr:hypothetical protein [Chromatiaceae bacterium]